MKKSVKIISVALIVMMAIISVSNMVFADVSTTIDTIGKGNNTDTTKISNFGATLVTIIQTIGIAAAILVLLILGIKYMMGSAEEKAEYKKTMIPYLIGAALLFGGSAIVKVVYNVVNSGVGQV